MKLHPLKCPNCGNPVEGNERDKVFTCPQCIKAFHIKSRILFPIKVINPLLNIPPSLFLPFWHFIVELGITFSNERKRNPYQDCYIPDAFSYPAFLFLRYSYFANLPIELGKKIKECTDYESTCSIRGGSREPDTVKKQLPYSILGYLHRISDIKDIKIDVRVKQTIYVGIPFSGPSDGRYTDLVTGATFPVSCLPDLMDESCHVV